MILFLSSLMSCAHYVEIQGCLETLGQPSYSPIASELKNQLHRRSIYLSSDVSTGDSVNENNIKVVRPDCLISIL